jgi:hypothetical protein
MLTAKEIRTNILIAIIFFLLGAAVNHQLSQPPERVGRPDE